MVLIFVVGVFGVEVPAFEFVEPVLLHGFKEGIAVDGGEASFFF